MRILKPFFSQSILPTYLFLLLFWFFSLSEKLSMIFKWFLNIARMSQRHRSIVHFRVFMWIICLNPVDTWIDYWRVVFQRRRLKWRITFKSVISSVEVSTCLFFPASGLFPFFSSFYLNVCFCLLLFYIFLFFLPFSQTKQK